MRSAALVEDMHRVVRATEKAEVLMMMMLCMVLLAEKRQVDTQDVDNDEIDIMS